jgi:hypothetical protein
LVFLSLENEGLLLWKPWEGFHTFPRSGFGGLSPPPPTRWLWTP